MSFCRAPSNQSSSLKIPSQQGKMPAIRAHYADILCQLAEERQVSRSALLNAAGIRASLLNHPENFITVDQFSALCREAIRCSGDPCLGIEYGKRLKFTTHGALSQAAISCDTIGQALDVLIKYFRIRFVYMKLECFTEGSDAVLQLDVLHDVNDLYRFNVEVVMASLMDVNLLLFGPQLLDGGSCRVSYQEPDDASAYHSLFGHRLTFDAGANQLRFRREFLDLPISLSNPVARRVAEAQCEEEMKRLEAAESAAGRVERVLETVRDGRLPTIEAVAEELRVSPRTLRRQLHQEGARFQDILEGIRHQRALELLKTNNLSVDAISDRLGYSDPSNFGRAFRKWEGVSPSVWRKQNAG
ncbi:AraC family transcriptional regulator [Marinobacter sp. CHS3-4]|uniref:AraC family transcriptional regulator n=1 Tax=Marinobacter sp. CHS3-4 TaxID=3045174 RepID=UPI0024B48DB1|nr:AraC family transcriptional regulator [Marinobacter sp. CHS3-4]MDI9246520.1 AraC family transcriptional regulator [Marinobacter sp. CHS3-4]